MIEFLVLESAQAGLSWITILRKREGYRKAFYNFDAELVAQMTYEDVERLMQFEGIVKNRLKIKSTITNAKLFLSLIHIWFLKYLKQINNDVAAAEKELERSIRNEDLLRLMKLQKTLVFGFMRCS